MQKQKLPSTAVCFCLHLVPSRGMQVLNRRTLGKVSSPTLLLRVGLSPDVDPWLSSEIGGLTFDLPWIQDMVFTERVTTGIWENKITEHAGDLEVRNKDNSTVPFCYLSTCSTSKTVSLSLSPPCVFRKMVLCQKFHTIPDNFRNHT